MAFSLERPDVDFLVMAVQAGVVSRAQLLQLGARPHDIDRLQRRRDLTPVRVGGARLPGVYITHTGRLSRKQQEWAAVLAAEPAALAGLSALPDETPARVTIAIDVRRTLRLPPWIDVRRLTDLTGRTDWKAEPPRLFTACALIDAMSERISRGDVDEAFAILARTLHGQRITPDHVLRELARRGRVPGRRMIEALLTDARDGVCSVLERGYLEHVERSHGLPVGQRQQESGATGARTLRDVDYDEFGLVVELNGRAIHDNTTAWNADAARDLAELAASDARTARVTYGMVFGRNLANACITAARIGAVLTRLGWAGQLKRCPRCPPAA